MDIVVIRGGGDIGSGIAHRLYMGGFKILILEVEKPLSIRREVSFSEAIYQGEKEVENIKAVHVKSIEEIYVNIQLGNIPVYIDEKAEILDKIKPLIVVDSTLAKKNLGTYKNDNYITIGVGPGFEAEKDVNYVIESMRGHNLGRVIYRGKAMENTGVPGNIMGFTEERLIRANDSGYIDNKVKIGDRVEKGQLIATINDKNIYASISGVVRGLIKENLWVKKGLKIGDIDPRNNVDNTYTISDKARAIGGGVLEAIMHSKSK